MSRCFRCPNEKQRSSPTVGIAMRSSSTSYLSTGPSSLSFVETTTTSELLCRVSFIDFGNLFSSSFFPVFNLFSVFVLNWQLIVWQLANDRDETSCLLLSSDVPHGAHKSVVCKVVSRNWHNTIPLNTEMSRHQLTALEISFV